MTDHRSRAAALYALHGPAVYRRCLRLLKEPQAARDATQEIFVKLVGNMERLSDRETVLPWIFQVATHHCLNLRRNAHRRGDDAAMPDLEIVDPGAQGTFPDRVLVRQVLAQFDVSTQAVAVGVLVDGMDHEEVAAVLGVSRRTVARRLERFLERARRLLAGSAS